MAIRILRKSLRVEHLRLDKMLTERQGIKMVKKSRGGGGVILGVK